MNIPWWKKIILLPVALLIVKTPWQGAQTNIYCAVAKELDGVSGHYFADCKEKEPSPAALDELASKQLWSLSLKLTGPYITIHNVMCTRSLMVHVIPLW